MLITLTGLGFSAAAGMNAFIPLAMLATLDRFTGIVDLAPGFSWLSSWPAIIVLLCFLVVELVLDKIPGIDTVNDLIQTPTRPVAAALVFSAAVTAQVSGTDHEWILPMWVAWSLGLLVGLTAHLSKAASRTAIGAATGGSGTPLASFAEDGALPLSVGGSLIDTGKWWVEEDKLCVEFTNPDVGAGGCSYAVLDGCTMRLFDLDGTLSNVFEYSRE